MGGQVSSVLPRASVHGLAAAFHPQTPRRHPVAPHSAHAPLLLRPWVGQVALGFHAVQLSAVFAPDRQATPALLQVPCAIALLDQRGRQRAGAEQRGERQAAQRLRQMFAVARLAGAASARTLDAHAQARVLVRRVHGVLPRTAGAAAASPAAAQAPLVAPGGLEGETSRRTPSRGSAALAAGRRGCRRGDGAEQGPIPIPIPWQRWGDAEAEPFLQGGVQAALRAARGQGGVTAGWVLGAERC